MGASELRWYGVPGAGSGFNDERARGAPLRALRPGPAGVVDDHAAQEPILAGSAQADAQVAARCPAGGQEAHVRSAGRGLELQFVAHALEALDDRVATLRLGVAAGVLVDDPAVAPDFVAPRSEEHTSELQSLMRNSYAVFCLKKNTEKTR